MAADEGRSRSFPMLSARPWFQIRARFARSLPAQVTPQYVETILGISPKSAGNVTPALRTLGLIDADGRPTPLANEWRTDEGYASACEKILTDVYPPALRDAVPPDDPDKVAAERWFVRERGVGESAASKMASLYVLIAKRDLSGAERQRRPRGESAERTRQRNGGSQQRSRVPQTDRREQQQQQQQQPPPEDKRKSVSPSLHIDVQVHIPSDATPEQIDAIFASMAKHLYPQTS